MRAVDQYSDWDAAYVLGSLTPQERRSFEDHLAGCAECREAVAELAAMPGLLAQLPPAEALALNDDARLSDDSEAPIPESISAMQPPRRSRRTMITMVLAIMLSMIIGGVIGYLIRDAGLGEPPPPAPQSAVRVAFEPVQGSQMVAVADVAPYGAGTNIDVDCMYSSKGAEPGAHRYLLYVINEQGQRVESTSWYAEPGEGGTPQLRSRLPMSGINALEIVLADNGMLLMRAPVP